MSAVLSLKTEPVAEIARASADIDAGSAIELLARNGVLVIEGAMDKARLGTVRAELDPWFDLAHRGAGPLFGRATKRFGAVFAKAPSVGGLAIDPLVLEIMEKTLKGADPKTPRCDAIELNLSQAIGIEPGEPAQFLHRDEDLWPFKHDFEIMTNVMWALDDFTLENGATRLIPGSHLWPRDRQPRPGEAQSAVAPAGSAIVWLGGLLHGGGANNSNLIRRGVVVSYRLAWLSPMEKMLLSISPEVARTFPERLQRLMGYQIHRPNLGWVEGQDPLRWLNGETGALATCEDNLAPEHEALLAAAQADPTLFAGYIS